MRLMMSIASMLLFGVVANGCSNPIAPESIVGLWDMTATVPGNARDMTLELDGSTISGHGNWCGEALRCGTTSVTGTAIGNRIHLITTFDDGRVEKFDGKLTSENSLVGRAQSTTPPEVLSPPQAYHRLVEDPPTIQ